MHVVLGLRKQSDNHQFGLLSSGLTAVTASTLRLQCVCVCVKWPCISALLGAIICLLLFLLLSYYILLSNFLLKFQTVIRLTTARIMLSTICDKWRLHFWNSQTMPTRAALSSYREWYLILGAYDVSLTGHLVRWLAGCIYGALI